MKKLMAITLICGLADLTFSQNFGIDIASPTQKLDVNGSAYMRGEVYTDGWFRNNVSALGLYNQALGRHFYNESNSYWTVASANGLIFRNAYAGTITGYTYWDGSAGSNNFGLLSPTGNWRVRVDNSNVETYGGLYTSTAYIPFMYDRDNTGYYVDPASVTYTNDLRWNYTSCINGYCPSNNVIRHTPNLHLNSYNGYAVILNWDNGTTGANQTLRVGNGAGSDVFYVYADGQTYCTNWFRPLGQSGLYFQSYGGGFYMIDGTWIRGYGARPILNQVNTSAPALRGDQSNGSYWACELYGNPYALYASGYIYSTYYGYLSSKTLKHDIVKFNEKDYESALAFMDELDLNYYKMNNEKEYNTTHVGFIAEETPGNLTTPGKLGARYGELSIYNTGAIKVLKKEVEELKSQLRNVSDFGVVNAGSGLSYINFSDEFKNQLNGMVPVVVLTSLQTGVVVKLKDVTREGFNIENQNGSPVTINWIAMAKLPANRNQADQKEYTAKFNEMLSSNEYEMTHRPAPNLSQTPSSPPADFVGPDKTPVHDPSVNDANKYIQQFNAKTKAEDNQAEIKRVAEASKRNYTYVPEDGPQKNKGEANPSKAGAPKN